MRRRMAWRLSYFRYSQMKVADQRYMHRTLSNTEQHYTQIEKESLAVTWACEHFNGYLYIPYAN